MKTHQQVTLIGLLVLLALALVGLVLTSTRENPAPQRSAAQPSPASPFVLVDQWPLETAQKMAALAATSEEQELAREALRLGDHEVDLAFASALRNATQHPAPLTHAAREQAARVKEVQGQVKARQDRVARLTQLISKAEGSKKDALQQQLELAQAQLDLDQDELADAQQDLFRAGGNPQSAIQRAIDAHEASVQHFGANASAVSAAGATDQTAETTTSRSAVAQFRAWSALEAKRKLLRQVQQDALARAAGLSRSHDALEQEVKQEELQKSALAQQATSLLESGNAAASSGSNQSATAALSAVRHLNEDQKNLAEFDKRIEDEQGLADVYAKWFALVKSRQKGYLHGLIESAVWILLIALAVMIVEPGIQRFFAGLAPERKRLHTLRSVVNFSARAAGAILILLVIFGPPNQFATVLALAGAGLTVALKDFIVGFFGWFVLMGRNGIRPGDWVEINGVGGEVVEVGLLHTVLLETGNWSEAGHPTGRKVTFVNSFAIEGHYFNFSTTGQWLWDELQVLIPAGADPYPIAEAIQKIVAEETSSAASQAQEEWERVTRPYGLKSFSAAPTMSVRPTNQGVNVIVRYITRAHERHEVRGQLYRAVVELLHRKRVTPPSTPSRTPQSVGDRK